MKKLVLAIAIASFLAACGDTKPAEAPKESKQVMEPELHTQLYGTYVGEMNDPEDFSGEYEGESRITINISHITAKGVQGKSVINGNDRTIVGALTQSGDNYKLVMDQPGDHKLDGRFEFTIKGDTLTGTWASYDTKSKNPTKVYTLVKKPFKYNPNVMISNELDIIDYSKSKTKNQIFTNDDGTTDTIALSMFRAASDAVRTLNSSTQVLTEAQLKNLEKLDLEILRNTIFARHGYSFKNSAVRQFFNYEPWYVPVSNNVDANLTDIEKKNIDLIQRLEKHAKDTYDNFGR